MQELVDRRGGHRFLETEYLKWPGIGGSSVVHGQIVSGTLPVNRKTVGGLFGEGEIGGEPRLWRGKSLALVVWPGKHPTGKPIVRAGSIAQQSARRLLGYHYENSGW